MAAGDDYSRSVDPIKNQDQVLDSPSFDLLVTYTSLTECRSESFKPYRAGRESGFFASVHLQYTLYRFVASDGEISCLTNKLYDLRPACAHEVWLWSCPVQVVLADGCTAVIVAVS